MTHYHKIETIYNRDTTGTKKLIPGSWCNETVKFLADVPWEFTEKIDGVNVRIVWDGHNISFAGRTEKTTLDFPGMREYLETQFGGTTNEQIFEQMFGEREVILFGEGYGGCIQAVGSQYSDAISLILFDVMINGNYQSRKTVEEVAEAFACKVVPIVLTGTLQDGVDFVRKHPKSTIGTAYMEGVVGRPAVELQDRCGNRVIVKIKHKDFKGD